MMAKPRCRSAKQRAYRQAKMAEAMDRWRAKTHLHDAMTQIEQEYSDSDRARVGMMLVGGIPVRKGTQAKPVQPHVNRKREAKKRGPDYE